MTALRQRLIEEITLRGYSPKTTEAYVHAVAELARYYHRAPDRLTDPEVRAYLLHLHLETAKAASTLNVAVSGLRFFYQRVLNRPFTHLERNLPRPRQAKRRPKAYTVAEVKRLLDLGCPNPKHRAFLMTVYGGGLRLNEACHLRPEHLDRSAGQIRVEQGKERNYAKVVVMRRWSLGARDGLRLSLYLAEGWSSRKLGEICEKPAVCRFRLDKATVQERLSSAAHGRQLSWHSSQRLRVGFARARVHPWRDTFSRPDS